MLLDATDQLEFPDQNGTVVEFGIQPQLAALETIVYPASSQLLSNNSLALPFTVTLFVTRSAITRNLQLN